MSEHEITPVQVHVVADTSGRAAPASPRRRGTYATVTLTAGQPAQAILPEGPRRHAIVCALDSAVTLSDSLPNAAAGVGSIIPAGMPWPVVDDGVVYAGASGLAGGATARVSVTAVYEA